MHLFHDSTLKLITEKLPEKPDPKDYTVDHTVPNNKYHRARMEYDAAIAALKQNALTVGNPEIIDGLIRVNKNWINGNPIPDELYFWPGGYKTREIYDKRIVTAGGVYKSNLKNVAILTLPEEKKNTMENMTKEQAIVEREFKQTGEILTDIVGDFFERIIHDPKGMSIEVKEFENSDTRLSLLKRGDRTIAGVVETRTEFNNVEFIKFSLHKDFFGVHDGIAASGSVAAPKEEPSDSLDLERFMHNCPPTVQKFVFDQAGLIASLRQQLKEREEAIKSFVDSIESLFAKSRTL